MQHANNNDVIAIQVLRRPESYFQAEAWEPVPFNFRLTRDTAKALRRKLCEAYPLLWFRIHMNGKPGAWVNAGYFRKEDARRAERRKAIGR